MTTSTCNPSLESDPRSDAYQSAICYADMGLSVFPLYRKKPRVEWTPLRDRPASERDIHSWFRNIPDIDGVGIIGGRASGGLCVRDFDDIVPYRDWTEAYPEAARGLPSVQTGRGAHVWSRLPPGAPEFFEDLTDGEVIGDALHYFVAPPSVHPVTGRKYWFFRGEPFCLDDVPVVDPVSVGFLPGSSSGRAAVLTSCVTLAGCLPPVQGEEEAVLRSLPSGPGERHSRLFDLARMLRGLPHLRDEPADGVEHVVRDWHARALPVVRTKSWAVTWRDFRGQWDAVRFPHGYGLAMAVRDATNGPQPPEAGRYDRPAVRTLVALCAALQRYVGEGSFFLSSRSAAALCGFPSHAVAAKWLGKLDRDGVLTRTDAGTPSATQRRAAEWRYTGERVTQEVVKGDLGYQQQSVRHITAPAYTPHDDGVHSWPPLEARRG